MADTLEKIYDNTLTDSSFDSNGEATIITTNSSTRHVIQDIKVKQGSTDIPITATLQDNSHELVSLSGNSSGKEIIGTSSSVKVKATTLPLVYADHKLSIQNEITNLRDFTIPTVAGTGLPTLIDKSTVETATPDTDITGHTYTNNDALHRQYWYNVGTQGRHVYIRYNGDHDTDLYILASNGTTEDFSHTTNYYPKWFDGHQYVYYLDQGNLKRVDINASTLSATTIATTGHTASHSTYGKCFGLKDKFIISWPVYNNAGGKPAVTDLTTNTSRFLSSTYAANGLFANSNYPMHLLETSTGATKIIHFTGNTSMRLIPVDLVSTDYQAQIPYETITLTNSGSGLGYESVAAIGSRVYYPTANNEMAFVDCETDTPTQGIVSGITIPSGGNTMPHGNDVWGAAYTPSSSTISGRTYNVSPSIALRITGVTSS